MHLWYEWCISVVHANTYRHFPHVLCICNGILLGFIAIKTLWLQLTLIIGVGTWQGQLQLTRSPNIWFFLLIFHNNLLCRCTSMQIPCYYNCLAVLLWQDEQHPKRIKTVYKTGQKTAMTQHIGLGSSISQNAFLWKGVPSPSFWSILTPVLSSLIYILYEKFQVLFVL